MATEINSSNKIKPVGQCQQSNWSAKEQLIVQYHRKVYNVISKICSNPEDTADLAQQTFVRVIENLESFEGRGTFCNWMLRIAVNLALSYCRRNARLRFISIEAGRNETGGYASRRLEQRLAEDSSFEPLAAAQNRETARMVLTALARLDVTQRTVIVLRDIEGVNYADIAGIMNIKIGTVKSKLSRARGRLRELLKISHGGES